MITIRDIVAWRQHAPWSNDLQVEQDLRLTRAMVAIFSDGFLSSQVAMRGGTALHKVHLAPAARYSEDIDLVLVGDRPEDHIQRALRRVLAPILGEPEFDLVETVRLAVRNLFKPSRVIRQVYPYKPISGLQSIARVKVEVNVTERVPFFDVIDLPVTFPVTSGTPSAITLRSYDIDEMIGTKMRALLQRDQGRDLFDLWWAISAPAPDGFLPLRPDRAVAAFQEYMSREGTAVSYELYAQELQRKLRLPSFSNDLNGMLRQGVPVFDPQSAANEVVESLLRPLDG
ncbi:MAG: nucleotidyl transferase AbiEii/AbiGii toxin family protein [Parvibaculum sp.]